jgi:hypothetical protein
LRFQATSGESRVAAFAARGLGENQSIALIRVWPGGLRVQRSGSDMKAGHVGLDAAQSVIARIDSTMSFMVTIPSSSLLYKTTIRRILAGVDAGYMVQWYGKNHAF